MDQTESKDDNKIKLSALISTLQAYDDNPIGDAEKAYNDMLAKLVITPYRTLGDKAASVIKIVDSITADNTLDYVIDSACAELAYGLLPYISNLEDDLSGRALVDKDGKPFLRDGKQIFVSLIDPALYDLCDRFGFIDRVKSYCDRDYAELIHMVDRALDFRDVLRLEKFAEDVSPERIEETIKAVRSFKGTLSPEDLKDLASIAAASDPAWLATKTAIADKAQEAAMEKAFVDSRPESERKAGAEAVAQYEAGKKAAKEAEKAAEPGPKA
jgi:hypothetical protein